MTAGAPAVERPVRTPSSPVRRVIVGGTFGVAVVTAAVTWSQVVTHLHAPDPIEARGAPAAIVWSDRVFRSEAEFASYLRRRGIRYERWVRTHPAAVRILRTRDRAAAASPAARPPRAAGGVDAGDALEPSLVVASIGGSLVLLAGVAAAVATGRVPVRRSAAPATPPVAARQPPPRQRPIAPVVVDVPPARSRDSAVEDVAPAAEPPRVEAVEASAVAAPVADASPVEAHLPASVPVAAPAAEPSPLEAHLPVPVEVPRPAVAAMGAGPAAAIVRCQVRWWRGYVRSRFYAVVTDGDGAGTTVGQSPDFPWRRGTPPTETPDAVAALEALAEVLRRSGWSAAGRGDAWYALRFETDPD